jgi:hypothetical protein
MEYFLGTIFGVIGVVVILVTYSVGKHDESMQFKLCEVYKLSAEKCIEISK